MFHEADLHARLMEQLQVTDPTVKTEDAFNATNEVLGLLGLRAAVSGETSTGEC